MNLRFNTIAVIDSNYFIRELPFLLLQLLKSDKTKHAD